MIIATQDIPIPAACGVDLTDAASIEGYKYLLIKLYEKAGGLSFPQTKVTGEMRAIEREFVEFVRLLTPLLSTAPLPDLPNILDSYDVSYRLGYKCIPSVGQYRNARINAIQRWAKGERTISSDALALLIAPEVNRDIRTLDSRYSAFYCQKLGEWVKIFAQHGRVPNVTLSENYEILCHLISTDLFAYLGNTQKQQSAKRRWAEQNLVADISTLSTPALKAYYLFTQSALTLLDTTDIYPYYLAELSSRHDLDPYFRQAIELELDKERV